MIEAKKRISINTRDTTQFYYGQKVYVIGLTRYEGFKVFREKCPVCGDTMGIELKGYKFKCPLCGVNGDDNGATTIEVKEYSVIEYIINRLEIKGSTYKNAYTAEGSFNGRDLPYVNWYGFSRSGVGYNDCTSRQFTEFDFREVDPDEVDIKKAANKYCFFSKAEAKRFCKRLHERQSELLDAFNAKHGTNHQYPFEY